MKINYTGSSTFLRCAEHDERDARQVSRFNRSDRVFFEWCPLCIGVVAHRHRQEEKGQTSVVRCSLRVGDILAQPGSGDFSK